MLVLSVLKRLTYIVYAQAASPCLLDGLVSQAGHLAHTKASRSTRIVLQPIVLKHLVLLSAALAVTPPDRGPCIRSWAAVCVFRTPLSPSLPLPLVLPVPHPLYLDPPPSVSFTWDGAIQSSAYPHGVYLHQVPCAVQALSGAASCVAVCWLCVGPTNTTVGSATSSPAGPHRSRPPKGDTHIYIVYCMYIHTYIHMHCIHSHPTAEAPTPSQR